MALRAKNRSIEAESAGFGYSKLKDENEVWADFHPSDVDLSLGIPVFRRNPGPWQTNFVCQGGSRRDGANFPHFFVARRFSNQLQRAPRASN
jgi:hypothetical protein